MQLRFRSWARLAPGFLLAVVAALPATAHAASGEDLAVVRIQGRFTCSAFLVRPDTFLTAKHCVIPPGPSAVPRRIEIQVDRGTGESSSATLAPSSVLAAPGVWHDDFDIDGQDFAVLALSAPYAASAPGVTPLRIHDGDPSALVGEEVELIGFGFKDGTHARKHATSRIASVGATIVVSPAVACPGDSGGVLLRARTREAVGIASREWPLYSDPCASSGPVPETTIFQRIDTHAALIDRRLSSLSAQATTTPTTEDAPPASAASGCATSRSAHAAGLAAAIGVAAGVAIRKRRARPRRA